MQRCDQFLIHMIPSSEQLQHNVIAMVYVVLAVWWQAKATSTVSMQRRDQFLTHMIPSSEQLRARYRMLCHLGKGFWAGGNSFECKDNGSSEQNLTTLSERLTNFAKSQES